ncbi:hypothetical protein GCM10017653_14820 [Ancylobacter defluvii]|uniref:Uncharacterized protein n=1 Tax=Ancylobacter defluvii TaxID=1282440 RepID=A0A9W6NA94_9HYPH|nr:hypothetical protein GCM10017653_14820 [Ancylobacter defluvii]
MLLDQGDPEPGARQQQRQHEAGRAGAGDDAIEVWYPVEVLHVVKVLNAVEILDAVEIMVVSMRGRHDGSFLAIGQCRPKI